MKYTNFQPKYNGKNNENNKFRKENRSFWFFFEKIFACGGHPPREAPQAEGRSPTADCVGAKLRPKNAPEFWGCVQS